MTFDLSHITPVPASWFAPTVEYEGHGKAIFANPKGTIEGPAKVRFDEFGESSVELEIKTYNSEGQLHFGLFELVSGAKPVVEEKSVSMGFGGLENKCTELIVTTPQGAFTASGNIIFSLRQYKPFKDEGKLDLYPLHSQFDANSSAYAEYWVMPIFNLVSDFIGRHPTLDHHPLRIFPTPVVPPNLTGNDALYAKIKANEKNRLIIFEFDGQLAFIEKLEDFEERKRKLLSGRERTMVTAVMVGKVGAHPTELTYVKRWPPFEFLSVLGLATGVEVDAPWIEFRDAEGALVRRTHIRTGQPPYSWGRAAIREDIHGSTGHLLIKYQSSPERGKPHLLTAMNYAVKAGLNGLTLEDTFDFLCRGLESVCDAYGLKKQNLLRRLDETNAAKVSDVLKHAAEEIRLVANSTKPYDHRQGTVLEQIAARTQTTPTGIDRSFGLAVVDLLKQLDLPDTEVADRIYASNPSYYRESWVRKLNVYRADAVHQGYFDFQNETDINQAFRVTRHLQDILIRVILKMLRYEGKYQPSTITLTAAESVDWVKPNTPARLLGYS